MRAAILVLAGVVVALAVSIAIEVNQRPAELRQVGPRFDLHRLVADSVFGETATYREAGSRRVLRYAVVERPATRPEEAPLVRIRRDRLTDRLEPDGLPGDSVVYAHQLVYHGWFPLMAPEVPLEFDRVWVIREIHRDTLRYQGKDLPAWRVEFTDPALPAGSDTVVAWFDPELPVFGLRQWERNGETWVYEAQGGRP